MEATSVATQGSCFRVQTRRPHAWVIDGDDLPPLRFPLGVPQETALGRPSGDRQVDLRVDVPREDLEVDDVDGGAEIV